MVAMRDRMVFMVAFFIIVPFLVCEVFLPLFVFIVPHFGGFVKGFLKLFFVSRSGSHPVGSCSPFPFRHDYYTINLLQKNNRNVKFLLNRRAGARVTADPHL